MLLIFVWTENICIDRTSMSTIVDITINLLISYYSNDD